MKNLIEKYNAQTVVDLGCAECKLVFEMCSLQLRRVIGVDLDPECLNSKHVQNRTSDTSRYDEWFNSGMNRRLDLALELYQGDLTKETDERIVGVDFVACVELIEHIEKEDQHGLVATIFERIKPKTALITTPNFDFNVHFGKNMPNYPYRHWDHRFEWTRDEFAEFVAATIKKYPDYEAEISGIGEHWAGKHEQGYCSQAAIFHKKTEREKVMDCEVDFNSQFGQVTPTGAYHRTMAVTLKAFNFEDELEKAIKLALHHLVEKKQNETHITQVHQESGVGPRYQYYDQPSVRAENWLPEERCTSDSFISTVAYPPKQRNKMRLKPFVNEYKEELNNELTSICYYTDIEDEKEEEEEEEEIPVANVETDFKQFSCSWGRASPDNKDEAESKWGVNSDDDDDNNEQPSTWSKPEKASSWSQMNREEWAFEFSKVNVLFSRN